MADLDSARRMQIHAEILQEKTILQSVFKEFHQEFLALDLRYFGDTKGLRIELGAGVAPVRNSFKEVLATDVVSSPALDGVLDAQAMDLEDSCVRALYGQNCFHHFSDPQQFFSEAARVVAPGGGVILIEPFYGPTASLLYPRLFASEIFDKRMQGWMLSSSGPMTGANQALSYLIFHRDRALFAALFPQLEVMHMRPLRNYVRYLLSGGLNFRQLVPGFADKPLKCIEWCLSPLAVIFALHHVIVIRRR